MWYFFLCTCLHVISRAHLLCRSQPPCFDSGAFIYTHACVVAEETASSWQSRRRASFAKISPLEIPCARLALCALCRGWRRCLRESEWRDILFRQLLPHVWVYFAAAETNTFSRAMLNQRENALASWAAKNTKEGHELRRFFIIH